MRYGYGVDLGGTAVKIGFFSEDGRLLERFEAPTDRSDGGRRVPADIAGAVLAHMGRRDIPAGAVLGIGLGVPGQVWPDGTADAENLGWAGFPLVRELEAASGLRVAAGNDANAAAVGEAWQGGGRGYRSLVFVTLGTGVGGGILIDGKCLTGAHGAGGEIGHIPVEPGETRRCACGSFGCLEQYASASGCARMAREALAASDAPSALRAVPEPDAKAVWDAAKAGDELARQVADRFCAYLGRGLAAVANIVDPEVIVIGGGVSAAGRPLIDGAARHYRKFAFPPCKDTPLVQAALGNDAGMYGAISWLISQ